VLEALSVFRGGCTREAAQAVAGASLRDLTSLVDRSLLHRGAAEGGARFEMHELLRQYATEKLDRGPEVAKAVRDRHCATYCSALQRWETELKGPRQRAAMAEMEAEIDNARAAWEWAVEGLPERAQVERLGQAMDGLGLFYGRRDRHQEGESTFRLAAERLAGWPDGSPEVSAGRLPPDTVCRGDLRTHDVVRPLCAQALTWQARFCLALGRSELAGDLLRQSLDLLDALASADTRRERAWTLLLVGGFEMVSGHLESAWQPYEQALVLYRALDRRWDVAETLGLMAQTANLQGKYDRIKGLCQEALAIRRALGDQWGLVESLRHLGVAFRALGQFEEDERVGREGLAIARESGDPALIRRALYPVARVLMWKGEFAESRDLAEEGLRIANDMDTGYSETTMLTHLLGLAMAHLGRYKEARVHAQQALARAQEAGHLSWFAEVSALLVLGLVALAEGNHAEAWEYLQERIAIVRELGDPSNVGLTLAALAGTAREQGRLTQARELLCEALELCSALRAGQVPLIALPVAALVLADLGDPERAVEIYALASRYPHVARSRLWEDLAGRRIAALAVTLPPEEVAAAQARGRARDTQATIDELAAGLRNVGAIS